MVDAPRPSIWNCGDFICSRGGSLNQYHLVDDLEIACYPDSISVPPLRLKMSSSSPPGRRSLRNFSAGAVSPSGETTLTGVSEEVRVSIRGHILTVQFSCNVSRVIQDIPLHLAAL